MDVSTGGAGAEDAVAVDERKGAAAVEGVARIDAGVVASERGLVAFRSTQKAATAESPIVPPAIATQARPVVLRAIGRDSDACDERESRAGFDTG